MSLTNHPNFHVIGFASDVMASYYERLRVSLSKIDTNTQDKIVNNICLFVEQMEYNIDQAIKGDRN